jgi:hypothetical protein
MDITGVDYLKAAVDEHFSTTSGEARWKSSSEDGHYPAEGFYLSNNGSTLELTLLAAALSKAKDNHLALLPAGEAGLERVTDLTVRSHGQTIHVTEFAITALAFTPVTVWLDDEGRFFGTPSKWLAELRTG